MGHSPEQFRCCAQNAGGAQGHAAKLEEAVVAYREALKEWTRERAPFQWAATQNNLGNALRVLGERTAGSKRSLKRRPPPRCPLPSIPITRISSTRSPMA